jgi:hypothetical protein
MLSVLFLLKPPSSKGLSFFYPAGAGSPDPRHAVHLLHSPFHDLIF